MPQKVELNKIFETVTGSHAYGTSIPSSDTDYRGIFIGAKEAIITGMDYAGTWTDPKAEDRTLYEVRKALLLIADQNPNMLELLWVRDKDIVSSTHEYDLLRGERESLLSSKAMHTFSGYAFSQLKRIKGHNKWINNPQPKSHPRQVDFLKVLYACVLGVSKEKVAEDLYRNRDEYVLIKGPLSSFSVMLKDALRHLDLDFPDSCISERGELITCAHAIDFYPDRIHYMLGYDANEYKAAKDKHEQYWTWKNNRNKKRSALEEEHGYDTKHAMHLIRLLRMGKEILEDGVVNVYRDDAEELLEIRAGFYSYDNLIAQAESYQKKLESLYKTTPLQKAVPQKVVKDLLMNIYEEYWKC